MTIQQQLDRAHAEDLITVEEFALIARYSPQTVYRKIKRGDIPGVRRYGKTIRIVKKIALGWVVKSRPSVSAVA